MVLFLFRKLTCSVYYFIFIIFAALIMLPLTPNDCIFYCYLKIFAIECPEHNFVRQFCEKKKISKDAQSVVNYLNIYEKFGKF